MPTQHKLLSSLRLEASGIPIYVQLREQFLGAIAAGLLRPGDQMPTMREVAVTLKVDLNTVRRSYDELERLGVVVLERGRGSFVADPQPAAAADVLEDRTEALARQALAAAAAGGVDPAGLAQRILALIAIKEET